ncbi:MAG: histidine kinase [Deltaproteobacteria bacterium]|nr:histidine kinase [Deltaproteobacteria bacterium]
MPPEDLMARRERLARELAEARAALPAHSVRPWQWQRVEDLEEELATVERQLAGEQPPA